MRLAGKAVTMSPEASANARHAIAEITRPAAQQLKEERERSENVGLVTPTPTSDDVLEKGGPMPRSIGRCADLYNDVRSLRLTMEKEVEKVKARETEVKEHIIANLSKSDDTGAAGLRYRAQIVTKDVPRALDWALVHGFIQKTGRFDLLQKRLGEKAVMDMVEQGETIPGVEVVHLPDVSITKIGR